MNPPSESPTLMQQFRLLVRAGGLAIGWPQLVVSCAAVTVFWFGESLLEHGLSQESRDGFPPVLIRFQSLPDRPEWPVIEPAWWDLTRTLVAPWRSVAEPVYEWLFTDLRVAPGFRHAPRNPWMMLLQLAFAAAVWTLFGIAIGRSVAVQLSRDRGESLPEVMRFSLRRWMQGLGALSIPATGIAVLLLGVVLAAWFGRLPGIGGPVMTFLSPLLFLAGLAIAVLALAMICGWPLMVAALSVEDCDGFGAFSRSFSFLTGRPLTAIGQALVSLVFGAVLVAVVGGVFTLALLAEAKPLANIGGPAKWSAVLEGSHLAARFLLAAFSASLFWSLITGNYLLLRWLVDRKPPHDLAALVEEPSGSELPIVGIPAATAHDVENTAEQTRPVVPA